MVLILVSTAFITIVIGYVLLFQERVCTARHYRPGVVRIIGYALLFQRVYRARSGNQSIITASRLLVTMVFNILAGHIPTLCRIAMTYRIF